MIEPIEPIRRSVTVDCSPEHAFRVFTKELDTWWPLHTHAIADQETGLEVSASSSRSTSPAVPRVAMRMLT